MLVWMGWESFVFFAPLNCLKNHKSETRCMVKISLKNVAFEVKVQFWMASKVIKRSFYHLSFTNLTISTYGEENLGVSLWNSSEKFSGYRTSFSASSTSSNSPWPPAVDLVLFFLVCGKTLFITLVCHHWVIEKIEWWKQPHSWDTVAIN